MPVTNARRLPALKRSLPAGLLGLVGLVLGGLAFRFLMTHPDPAVWWRLEVFVVAGVSAGIVFSARWLARSDYGTDDLWVILGWSVAGIAAAGLLGAGIYVHQTMEQVSIAEPTFLFESLALLGAGLGVAVGVRSRRTRAQRRIEAALDDEPVDEDAVWAVLSLLGDETQELRERWAILASLVDTTTREAPVEVLATRLADSPLFPDDASEVEARLYDEHLPVLVGTGVVEVDREARTVAYVGPEPVADHLSAA